MVHGVVLYIILQFPTLKIISQNCLHTGKKPIAERISGDDNEITFALLSESCRWLSGMCKWLIFGIVCKQHCDVILFNTNSMNLYSERPT